jgi:hypothetical protein
MHVNRRKRLPLRAPWRFGVSAFFSAGAMFSGYRLPPGAH